MDIIEAIEVLRMEGWVAAADRMQVLLGLLPAIDQAPIARVIVTDGAPAGVVLYAPGLPPGEFDVYLEPIAKGEQS